MTEVLIGIDPHKATNAVAAVDGEGMLIELAAFATADRAGLRSLVRWGKRFEGRRWVVEGAGGLGRHLAVSWRAQASRWWTFPRSSPPE